MHYNNYIVLKNINTCFKEKMMKKIAIATVLLTMSAICSAALLQSDDFNGTELGPQWGKYTNDQSKVGQSGGAAWFKKYYGDTGTERGIYSALGYDIHTENNFNIAINYDLTWDCPWHDDWRLTWDSMFLELYAGSKWAKIERRVQNMGDAVFDFIYDNVSIGSITLALTPESMEGMKLERVGDILYAYGKTTGEWQLLGSINVAADMAEYDPDANIRTRLWVNTDRDGQMRVNDFTISQIPEPMTAAIVLGCAAVLGLNRRKNA